MRISSVLRLGPIRAKWPSASPARLNIGKLEERLRDNLLPSLVVLDQSEEDPLVPVNQTDTMEAFLRKVKGLRVVRDYRMHGRHAAPWEEGNMLWLGVRDVLGLLEETEGARNRGRINEVRDFVRNSSSRRGSNNEHRRPCIHVEVGSI